MRTKTMALPDSGQEITIKELNYGQWTDIMEKATAGLGPNGELQTNPMKMQKLMVLQSVKDQLTEKQVNELSIRDVVAMANEAQELNFPDTSGKSSGQSQPEGQKTEK